MPCSAFRSILDRKSTRLNSSHGSISYAVFCFKNKDSVTSQKVGIKRRQSTGSTDIIAPVDVVSRMTDSTHHETKATEGIKESAVSDNKSLLSFEKISK